jgi:hypothetical protein
MHPNQSAAMRQRVLDQANRIDNSGFYNLLTGPQLLDQVAALVPAHRERAFPPTETLAMFMTQALSADGRCRQVVDEAAVARVIAGLPPYSTNTSAYCQARARLPLPMITTLTRHTGGLVTDGAPAGWHWQNRRVRLVDGATMTLADTPENQAEYPPSKSQKAGLGFPIGRMVVLLCLATGAVLDAAIGPCVGKGSDEQTLLRALLETLLQGEILLGDAYYPTYFLLCELVRRGVDGVFEQYGARQRRTDFRLGEWRGGARSSHRPAEAQETGLDESGGLRAGPGHVDGARVQGRWQDHGYDFSVPQRGPQVDPQGPLSPSLEHRTGPA